MAAASWPLDRWPVTIWDADSGEVIATLSGETSRAMAATYSPDGTRIAVSSSDQRSFKIWDAATLTEVALLGGKYAVESAAFAPDGTRIVAASYPDKNLKIFDAASGKVVAALSGHAEAVKAVAYSPDGKRIVSGSYRQDTQGLGHPDPGVPRGVPVPRVRHVLCPQSTGDAHLLRRRGRRRLPPGPAGSRPVAPVVPLPASATSGTKAMLVPGGQAASGLRGAAER